MAIRQLRLSLLCISSVCATLGGSASAERSDDVAGSVYDAYKAAEASETDAEDAGTVRGAIIAALTHNPQIRIAAAQHYQAKAERFRALGGFLPDIEATATYTDEDWRNSGALPTTGSDGTTIGVTAVQPVFQGLSAINRFRAARSRVLQAELALLSVMQQTALDAARAHAGVILARSIVDHRIENMSLVNRQLTVSEKRAQAGAQSRTGVEQAKMRLAQAQVDLGQARTNLAQQEAAFIRIVGRPPAVGLTPDESNLTELFASAEEAVAAARTYNPAISAADAAATAAKFDKNASLGAFAPRLTLEGSYIRRYGEDPLIPSQEDEEYQLLARMRVPIFRQGGNIAATQSANATVAQQEAQLTAAILAVDEIVYRSWRQLAEASARAIAAKSGIDAARQSVKGLELEYEAGQRSVIDVLDGQRDLVIAQINASQAEFELRVSQYELAAATGAILDRYGVSIDQ